MGRTMEESSILVLFVLHLAMLVVAESISPAPLSPSSDRTELPLEVPLRIDTHGHYVSPFYKALLDSRNITAGGLAIPAWDASSHLAFNDQLGIETSIVAVSTPGAKLSADSPIEEVRSLARQINEYGCNLTMEYPSRFLFWATLTLPDLEGAVAEAVYALDTLGAAGVIIEGNAYGEVIGPPRYTSLYKALDDRNATVFIHPRNSPFAKEPNKTVDPADIPPYVIDFLLDTSRAALTLVYNNVTSDYPNIKFILAHSGGFLPFAATRAAGALAFVANSPASQRVYYEKLRQFHVDLAVSASTTALVSTTAFFNHTQITFGTDYPYAPFGVIQQNTAGLLDFRLSKTARRNIDNSNAYGLFKKFLFKHPSRKSCAERAKHSRIYPETSITDLTKDFWSRDN